MSGEGELRRLWKAWQEDTTANPAKQQFEAVLHSARRGDENVEPELRDAVTHLAAQLPGWRSRLLSTHGISGSTVRLHRGIQDGQAQEILDALLSGGSYTFPMAWPKSFTKTEEAAGGFAWKASWAGVVLQVDIDVENVVFVADYFGDDSHLAVEDEVLVTMEYQLVVPKSGFVRAISGQVPAGAPTLVKRKKEARKALQEAWDGYLKAAGLTDEEVRRMLPGYGI